MGVPQQPNFFNPFITACLCHYIPSRLCSTTGVSVADSAGVYLLRFLFLTQLQTAREAPAQHQRQLSDERTE